MYIVYKNKKAINYGYTLKDISMKNFISETASYQLLAKNNPCMCVEKMKYSDAKKLISKLNLV